MSHADLGAFSPEKDHKAQLYAFHQLLQKYPEHAEGDKGVELVLIGGSRNAEDAARVEGLQALAKELKIEVMQSTTDISASPLTSFQDRTKFVVNASYPDMLDWLSRSSIGLSTMVDEHFGINIVEYMVCSFVSNLCIGTSHSLVTGSGRYTCNTCLWRTAE